MKTPIAVIAAALICVVANSTVVAEQKALTKKPVGGPAVRYFDLSSDIFSDLNAEAILKEQRQGPTVVSAELDLCYAATPGSSRFDRVVVPLKVEGNRLVGSAQSQELKRPVAVTLTRRAAGSNYSFTGSVKSGNYSQDVQSTGNVEMTEREFQESYATGDQMVAAPADFTEASPQALEIRVAREQLTNLLNALRDQNVRIAFSSLVSSCTALRSGHNVMQLDVDPERAGAVLAKVRGLPGVAVAGYAQNNHNWDGAIRFPSAGWRDGGKLDRDKLGKAIAGAIANVLAATVTSVSWDNATGLLTIALRRPDQTIPGVKLIETIAASILVSSEAPTPGQRMLLWIEKLGSRVIDEASGAKLEFLSSDEEGAEPEGGENVVEAVAAELKGQFWDSENETWQ
jgi:hypothetical protein